VTAVTFLFSPEVRVGGPQSQISNLRLYSARGSRPRQPSPRDLSMVRTRRLSIVPTGLTAIIL
jgi:hypothetical protein